MIPRTQVDPPIVSKAGPPESPLQGVIFGDPTTNGAPHLPSSSKSSFTCMNGYPYYVYNGYGHRYSTRDKCNYRVMVGDKFYPLTDGKVCSNSKNTKLEYYGCKSASQMENAGCLLSIAMLEGYCK